MAGMYKRAVWLGGIFEAALKPRPLKHEQTRQPIAKSDRDAEDFHYQTELQRNFIWLTGLSLCFIFNI
jgi:hypothetical protein